MGDLTPAGPAVSAELSAAVRDFRDAEGVLRHAAANDRERLERDRDEHIAALAEESGAAEGRLRDQVIQQAELQDSRLRAAVAALIPPARGAADPLAAAEYVDLGAASLAAELPGRTSPVSTLTVAPLLDHGNLVVAGAWSESVADLLRSVVYQALSGTGPGQLRIRPVDPEVRSALAVFSPLKAANDDLLSAPAGSDTEIEELLRGLVADLRSTVEMFHGRRTTLGRMRRETGQPIGTYQLLVVADYPARFTERARSDLVTIMRQGPVNGISTVLHHAPVEVEPRLAELGQVITVDGSSAQASWLPGWTTRPRSEPGLPEAVATLAERSRGAEAPRIDFLACQPDLPLMSDSSAMRLVATIGRAGHQPVAVTLGDEVDQRHNILVSGAVGQGKSNLLMAIIHSLAMRYPPAELDMHLLDFKEGVTLEPLGAMSDASPSWLPHARSIGLNSDRSYGAAVLAHLVAEFERRAAIIRGYGDDITKYRLADPAHAMARILVVVDEFQVLFDSDDDITERALADLERLARKGRAYGIHLLLASQTLSGITPLLAKQDGIFAQFPVRLALKNSASESQAVLDQNNTEAARLRYRGELLLNLDFGAVEANRRATVAWAAEDQLRSLRRRMCDALGADLPTPAVFDGAHAPALADSRAVLHTLRQAQRDRSRVRQALLGTALDVGAPAVGIPMTDDNGRHLAVVGAGASRAGSGAAQQN
ncbi:FtsK/SpoIIIE domain-containing protein [Jiangella endophytica]|uniref:FtsK/SpoIIIE domain-containing protein n=1 Tax=Jiangella endophytica TaxID=1623398 RepID=UPI000E345B89|nr:FtsK/SpoIIIE domain-containing protein [Jiangella endophytica]